MFEGGIIKSQEIQFLMGRRIYDFYVTFLCRFGRRLLYFMATCYLALYGFLSYLVYIYFDFYVTLHCSLGHLVLYFMATFYLNLYGFLSYLVYIHFDFYVTLHCSFENLVL